MTRRSRRELERAVDELGDDDAVADRCPECGGFLEGADVTLGVKASFVTYECTCDVDAPTDAVVIGR